jgi:hypothetical protein
MRLRNISNGDALKRAGQEHSQTLMSMANLTHTLEITRSRYLKSIIVLTRHLRAHRTIPIFLGSGQRSLMSVPLTHPHGLLGCLRHSVVDTNFSGSKNSK